MKVKRSIKLKLFLIITPIIFIFLSCEKSSLKKYQLTAYDGQLTWEQMTPKAEWDNRLDHEVSVLNDELFLAGGYNPGMINGDPYFEDVWKSSDGISWTNVTDNAPWYGRRGHALITFNDGNGDALYLIGGFSVNESTGERSYNNDVWKSSDGHAWEKIKNNTDVALSDTTDWVARMHHKVVITKRAGQNYMILSAGRTMKKNIEGRYAVKYCNDLWGSYNGIEWEYLHSNDFGIRSEHAMAVDDSGTLYIQGGQHGVIFDSPDSVNYEPIANYYHLWTSADGSHWEAKSNVDIVESQLLSRAGHELIYYKNRLWSLPGKTISSNHYHFTNPEHYPTWTYAMSDNWAIDSRGTAIDARHNYAAIVFKDKIWIFGGNTNKKGQNNDVWQATLN
jgi:hypothetical protein